MPPDSDINQEQVNEEAVALDPHLASELRTAYCQPPRLDSVDLAISRAVEAGAAWRELPRGRVVISSLRLRLVASITVLVVILFGVGVYLRAQTPNHASAQSIFQHARTAGLIPNQVTQFVYHVTSSAGLTSTIQFWVEANAEGAPKRLAIKGTDPTSAEVPLYLAGVYAAFGLLHLGPSSLDGSWLQGQQRLDGVLVDVVQAPDGAVLYFDGQTYIERGADWSSTGVLWRARLLRYNTVPASTVPAGSWQELAPSPRAAPIPSATSG